METQGLSHEQSNRASLAVITVHGTGDTAEGDEGEKWFQRGSQFTTNLLSELESHYSKVDIIPHHWSGANSAAEREVAARKLKKTIKHLSKNYDDIQVIGHSHGGNVANDAACMLNWSPKKRSRYLSGITTIGTPFFRTAVTRAERFGAWAFLILLVISVFAAILFTIVIRAMEHWGSDVGYPAGPIPNIERLELELENTKSAWDAETETLDQRALRPYRHHSGHPPPSFNPDSSHEEQWRSRIADIELEIQTAKMVLASAEDMRAAEIERRNQELWWSAIAVSIPIVLSLIVVLPLAFRGIARVRRAGRKKKTDPFIYSIWHPADEAISFLQKVEGLDVEAFPKWSMARASRTGAVLWGVRIIVTLALLGIISMALVVGLEDSEIADTDLMDLVAEFARWTLIAALAGAPILFLAVYIIYRLVILVLFEFGLRGRLNATFRETTKGIAFGRDGDNRVCDVAPTSHYYASRSIVLEGDLADRMLAKAHDGTRLLFDRYRASLFSIGADGTNAISEIAEDAMTWDSLVHTIYFDQPEMPKLIANCILAQKQGSMSS